MKENLTEIIFIVDRSGSMSGIKSDVIGGYNSFIDEQRKVKDQEANITFIQFDDKYEKLYESVDINEIKNLSDATYIPRGMTALYDAIGKTIVETGERLSNMPETERPSKVLVVIITDGYENSSQEYSQSKIKEMISHQETKYSWDFIFIAANIDLDKVSRDIGIASHKTMAFDSNSEDVGKMSRGLSSYTTLYRSKSVDYSSLDLSSFK